MAYKCTVLSKAEHDLAVAYTWYEKRQAGLGDKFLENFEVVLKLLEKNPFQFQRSHGKFRRVASTNFPFWSYLKYD